jgi:hypothetical protein
MFSTDVMMAHTYIYIHQRPHATPKRSPERPLNDPQQIGRCLVLSLRIPASVARVFFITVECTEHSFLIRRNTRQHIQKHAYVISNSSYEDSRYFAIIRRRLTSNDGLPLLKTCGIALVLYCLFESYVAHHQPNLLGKQVKQLDALEMNRIRNEQN